MDEVPDSIMNKTFNEEECVMTIMAEWSSRDLGLALGLTPDEVDGIENKTNSTSHAKR